MSVFDDATNITPNAFEELVGEDKKFKSPEDLARGKIEADRTIADRNRELQEQREEMNRLREELELVRRQPREPAANVTERATIVPVEEEPRDLASRIREEMERQTRQDQKDQNLNAVAAKLDAVYGERATEILRNKAVELGVSVAFLQDVAAQSPKAFYNQIGLNDSTSPPVGATHSDVNTLALADTRNSAEAKQGTYAYYEKIRRSDPKLYFSPQTQNSMFADAKRLGEAFYAK